jgi:hypothetical protein
MLFTLVAPRTKSKGLLIGGPLSREKFMLFTRVAPHTKSKGLPIGCSSLSKKTYDFYMRSTTYKKQGAPDRRSLTQQKRELAFYTRSTAYKKQGSPDRHSTHLLLLSARASSRTKSKGLRRYVLQIYYFNNQVCKSFCSLAGVIIPLCHPNNKPSDPDRRFNILLIYNCYQYTRSKGHLFIFIFIKFIQHAKEKDYRALGLSLSSDSARLVKSYEDTKS